MRSHKTLFIFVFALLVVVGAVAWRHATDNASPPKSTLTLALDWTPNTNHTGIYVALQKSWYKEAGINLKLLPYSATVSADTLVATGKADLGISSTEGIVADAGAGQPVISIAAIIAHNTSVLAVRKDSGITSPKQLDGKTYGGFGAPYETPVVDEVIRHAGGKGVFKNVTLDIDPVQALQTKKIDFVWIFSGWEVIQAERQGLQLTTFPLTNYGIPDYSTPNIISSGQTIKTKRALIQKFMSATARGYEFAQANSKQSAQILINAVPRGTFSDPGLVYDSQQYLSPRYQAAGLIWGVQQPSSWQYYPKFMLDQGAVLNAAGQPLKQLNLGSLYTNEFLE